MKVKIQPSGRAAGDWAIIECPENGWKAFVTQMSNKGPVVYFEDSKGKEFFRARFDMACETASVRTIYKPGKYE